MAIAFARISYHSRSKGHSAVGGAAYRAGVKLVDERTGEIHNYENRQDVVYSEILLPEGANDSFFDREALWNTVEAAENRKNSQVAKDIVLALPKELPLEKQIELAKNFAAYHFVNQGLVVDISIHNDAEGNPHTHLYVTTRRLEGDKFSSHKASDLEPAVARGRVVAPQYWGEQWRDFQNQFFIEHDIDLIVDANQMLTTRHEGRNPSPANHYIKQENILKKEAAREIALTDPEALLNHLGSQAAVFSEREIIKVVTDLTTSTEDYTKVMLSLKSHRDLIHLGLGEDGREHYTTRANYLREAKLVDEVQALKLQQRHGVSESILRRVLETSTLNEEQQAALTYLTRADGISVLVGRAGTGKSSFVLKAANKVWTEAGYRVIGASVSGVATKGLEKSSGIPSSILFGIKKQILEGRYELTKNDIFVMDEAGMTDLSDMVVIIDAVLKAGAKLVLVGDPAQLQPVGIGAPLRAIISTIGFTELNQIMRQRDEGDRKASILLALGDVPAAFAHYQQKGAIHLEETPDKAIDKLLTHWQQGLTTETLKARVILAHRNADVTAINNQARARLVEAGLVGQNAMNIKTEQGSIDLSMGDRILFLRNDKSIGVHNGDFATIQKIENGRITALLGQTKTKVNFAVSDYKHLAYGYAATVHKTQGATFEDVYVYAGGMSWNRHLSYVALTRHTHGVSLYADKETHSTFDKLTANLSRMEIRDSIIDWPLSFAIRRGFNPDSMVGKFIDKLYKRKEIILDKWRYVTNYEAYLLSKKRQDEHCIARKRRKEAKIVAAFVDKHRALGQRFGELSKGMEAGEPIYQHPEYLDVYAEIIEKNRLAHAIYQDKAKYALALAYNGLSENTIAALATSHEHVIAAEKLIKIYQTQNKLKLKPLAATLYPELKNHYAALQYLTKIQNINLKSLINDLRQAYERVEYQRLYKNSTIQTQDNLHLVKRYVELDRKISSRWQYLHQEFIIGKLSFEQSEQYHAEAVLRDTLAHDIQQQKEINNKEISTIDINAALTLFAVKEDRLMQATERFNARARVQAFYESKNVNLEHLASDIKQNLKLHLPYLNEFNLDTKAIHLADWRYTERLKLSALTREDKAYVKLLKHYRELNWQTANAWSNAFAIDEKSNNEEFTDTAIENKNKSKQLSNFTQPQLTAAINQNGTDKKIAANDTQDSCASDANKNFINSAETNTEKIIPDTSLMKAQKRTIATQWSLRRNKLAAEILNEIHPLDNALAFVKIDIDKLKLHAKAHQDFNFVQRYKKETRIAHRVLMANYIQLNKKSYHTALHALNVSYLELATDVRHHRYLHQLNVLPKEQQTLYHLIERYDLKRLEAGSAWGKVRAQQNKIEMTEEVTARLTEEAVHYSRQRNKIAAGLKTALYQHKEIELLKTFAIDEAKLNKAATEHAIYQKVYDYAHETTIKRRDELAHTLIKNKKYAREIYQQKLDWNVLRLHANAYERRQRYLTLSLEERLAWHLVDKYDQARLHAGKAWGDLFCAEKNGEKISEQQRLFCYRLTNVRNQLAYKIALTPDAYAPYLEKTRIKLDDLQKHAVQYSKQLQRQENNKQFKRIANEKSHLGLVSSTSKKQTDSHEEVRYFRYETVNNALINQCEEFYSKALGDTGKKAGNNRRYGKKGSLSVKLSGQNQGLWHSFETGTGGSPLQLLMNSEHGWGLSYEDAIKEGARLAGLSDHDAVVIHKKQKEEKTELQKAQETQQETEAKIKKQASARYYYLSAQPIQNTLGEKYLRESRKIEGDISEIRFHARVRDTRYDENDKEIVTYHPAIVVAARNEAGEIVASQTISLNPHTANKVDKDTVGAVKRSRGEVKGAAALIHSGRQDCTEVILAEGIETAASLIKAKPDAHIYATLGNTRNAEHLGWLAKKHNTNTLYFAADKDLNTNNLDALKQVAKTLKYEHNIDCYMALPKLENKDKYDFNDVLKEKGAHTVKEQLKSMQKIAVPTREIILDEATIKTQLETALGDKLNRRNEKSQQQPIPDSNKITEITLQKETEKLIELQPLSQQEREPYQTTHEDKATDHKNKKSPTEILQDKNLGWEKLRGIDDETVQSIVEYRDMALSKMQASEPEEKKAKAETKEVSSHYPVYLYTETTPEEDIASLYQDIRKITKEIVENTSAMNMIKEKAPEFAAWVAKQNQRKEKQPIPDINWLDKRFKADWEKIKNIDNSDVEYMLTYVKLSETQKEAEDQAAINQAISKLATDVVKDKKAFEEIKTKAPELAKLMQTQVRPHYRDKGMEREWD